MTAPITNKATANGRTVLLLAGAARRWHRAVFGWANLTPRGLSGR
jgi:hypothetical protein